MKTPEKVPSLTIDPYTYLRLIEELTVLQDDFYEDFTARNTPPTRDLDISIEEFSTKLNQVVVAMKEHYKAG